MVEGRLVVRIFGLFYYIVIFKGVVLNILTFYIILSSCYFASVVLLINCNDMFTCTVLHSIELGKISYAKMTEL